MNNRKQKRAVEMWNTATGGDKHSPATAFAGMVVGHGAPKYIPVYEKDFTAGNDTAERHDAVAFLEEWIKDFWSDEA